MTLSFKCLHCNKELVSKFLRIGEEMKCKFCGEISIIPEDAAGTTGSKIKKDQATSDVFELEKNDYMSEIIKINCKACDGKESMIPVKISRMSPAVQVIGWIITVPSIIGVVFSFIMFFKFGFMKGNAFGSMLGTGLMLFTGIASLVGGLIGYLLIMTKKVFKCTLCGAVIDRA